MLAFDPWIQLRHRYLTARNGFVITSRLLSANSRFGNLVFQHPFLPGLGLDRVHYRAGLGWAAHWRVRDVHLDNEKRLQIV